MNNQVGLITFYKDNFGSILQCYATKKIVESFGYKCNVLAIPEKKEVNESLLEHKIKRLKFILENTIQDPTFFIRWKKVHNTTFGLEENSKKLMDEFVIQEICPLICSKKILEEYGKAYYAFIVGSDQVWNINNKLPDYYFLGFAPSNKKIAFAVSFGTDKANDKFLETVKNGIEGFNKISVREESGAEIIRSISNVQVDRIADPTVMLSADEWLEISSKINVPQKNFILVHFLDCPSNLAIEYIEKMRNGRRVVCIAYRYSIFNEKKWDYIDCDPKTYVAYINAADEVYTDSFHTTMFSINLGKQFFVFERQYLHSHPQTSRLNNLLKRYKLEDRFIKKVNSEIYLNRIEIEEKQEIIINEREKARKYLYNSLREVDISNQ